MSEDVKTAQPGPTEQPKVQVSSLDGHGEYNERASGGLRQRVGHLFTKDAWLGDYDWAHLCMPRLWPYRLGRSSSSSTSKRLTPMPFYGLEDRLPILLAVTLGLQHCLAMLAGLITPPIILANLFKLDASTQSYLISASLIASGILSAIQMSAIRVPLPFLGRLQIGTGILSVVGTSFATLSTATAIAEALYADGTCPMVTMADGTQTRGTCPQGYGMVLGTAAVCGLLEVFLSFMPARVLRRMFPPLITGPVVFLIGTSLIGDSGFLNWGGGANDCASRPASGLFALCPMVGAPHALPWGSREFLGLGLFSFLTIVVVEIWGSPAMRSASVVIGLIFPTLVLGIPLHYTSRSSIDAAPAITFLWTTTFPLKVYGPAVLPLLAVYCSLMSEAIGDITASSEVSRLEVSGPNFDRRIKGGVLSDGLAGIFSALFTITPMSVFAQNNGLIGLTRVANRRAGYFCCFFLILFGILGKISGAILAIPNSILGGVTTFLFASVAVSGLSILQKVELNRRNRFILGLSLSLGLGNLLVPKWATYFLPETSNKALEGFYLSIEIIIETPFLICAIVGGIANLILPYESDENVEASQGLINEQRSETDVEANETQRQERRTLPDDEKDE
ncbi:Xanthine/uracil permease [Acaromyces ingoldii]|uniref:Xanthine/uracil permease n=1 Tax=Acaromyces ingoldii TaxID=215250 RepID=A0A316YNA5_9BASI|nr:Xanthine/uracil permease [Acaromyces ingoldii]PWN90148.1 Xanthine/uracil permease [Acaromyces ingoldii]